jgi:hypothetical protein
MRVMSKAIIAGSEGLMASAASRHIRIAALVILCLPIPAVQASCRLEELAEFHVDMVGNSPIIDGQINGHPIRIVLETGSDLSHLTRTAARQLDLPLRSAADRWMVDIDTYDTLETTVIKEFKIGKIVLKNYPVNVGGKVIHDGNGVAGFQLGADVLSKFTTEWDLAHGIVRFLSPQDCRIEQLAYWTPSYFQMTLEPQSQFNPSPELEVTINGKSTKAEIVSGSAISYIRPGGAREVGVDTSGPDAKSVGDITGLAKAPIPTWIGRFDRFEVGGETIENVHLLISELSQDRWEMSGTRVPMRVRPPEVYLGADFLRANHLIMDPERHVAVFTYNGGPVFNTDRPE